MNEMANGPIKIEMRARQTLDEETSVLPPSWQETMAPVRKRIGARGLAFLLISVVPTLLFALDEAYVKPTTTISNGATLALIPPVSGG